MLKSLLLILSVITTYVGRVVDEKGEPIPYATVYPQEKPEAGTATNNDGYFQFKADLPESSDVLISFIGYEKKVVKSEELRAKSEELRDKGEELRDKSEESIVTIVLKEQPIALQETVVATKAKKQRNKRKQMATLLHAVYVKLEQEFPKQPAQYQVVSDVRMNSENSPWGMEQMIANIIVLPEDGSEGRDSIQFEGRFCKRFFDAGKRAQADAILAGESLERMEKKSKEKVMRRAVNAVDSGVVVHRALFGMGNMRYDFEQAMNDVKHWTVSNESEGETVLTHTQKITKYLGLFQLQFQRHYIVDSRTYAVRRFSEHAEVKVTIPFGIKLNADQLQLLNLVNMDEQRIEKFRLKKLRGDIDFNTIYQRRNGKVYTLEKNLLVNAFILGAQNAEIPLVIQATQRVTGLETEGVKPMPKSQITRRLKREIVEIY